MLDNPEIIQPPHPSHPTSHLPIILLHDGGGTCFAYNCLDTIPRALYGIHNPKFWAGEKWEGGIPEMAALYAKMIIELVASPDFPSHGREERRGEGRAKRKKILLGGWSLGGLLSLQVMKELEDIKSSNEEVGVEVVGLLLIDSIYPVSPVPSTPFTPLSSSLPPLGPDATESQKLSRICINQAPAMIRAWTLPVFDELPPAVLIKAKDQVPVWTWKANGQVEKGVSGLDVHRADRELGWGAYRKGWIRDVLPAKGDHFSMFALENMEVITPVIERACRALEVLAERRTGGFR